MPTHHPITQPPAREVTQFPATEIRILRSQIDLALALVVELMDDRAYPAIPTSGRLKLAASAMQLRDALALVANRSAWDPPPAMPPRLFVNVDVQAFLNHCAADVRLPAIVRAAATELRDSLHPAGASADGKRVIDLAAYIRAAKDLAGASTKQAAQEAAVTEHVNWVAIIVGVALHRLACRIVGVPK